MTERAQPIEPGMGKVMVDIMAALDRTFNGEAKGPAKKTGIVLLTFDYGDAGRFNYISNGADRRDMAKMFREQAAKFDADPEINDPRTPAEREVNVKPEPFTDEAFAEKLQALARGLTDGGKLIEAGWVGLQLAAIPRDAPPAQLHEMRLAFFAGAQHLFSSITSIMEAGEEPTDADMARMQLIENELKEFITDFQVKHLHTKGSA